MSLDIDVDAVTEVLLDRWYVVSEGSFTIDAYEYLRHSEEDTGSADDFQVLHAGGRDGICATGFAFTPKDDAGVVTRIAGPLTAIRAVKCGPERPGGKKSEHRGSRVSAFARWT
jgi:hypothetical protein